MPIITAHKKFLIQRCESRGYSIEEVMPCVVSQDGDEWVIDTDHKAYPIPRLNEKHPIHQNLQEIQKSIPQEIGSGVGTELKKLLSYIGITSSPTCKCNQRAKTMNQRGINWCKENTDIISKWLEEEAHTRRLPYFKYIGNKLIKLAIHRAQRKQK